MGAGVHVEPHSHPNEQIAWMLKGKMEFRLGTERHICGPGDVVVIPAGVEHEAWFPEDTQVVDFFAPPRDDFLAGGKPPLYERRLSYGERAPKLRDSMGEAAFCEFRQRLAEAQCLINRKMTVLPNSQMLLAALIAAMLFTNPAFAEQDRCPAKVLAALDKLGIKRASADNAPEMQYFVPHDFGAGSLNLHCVGKIPELVIGVNSATPSEPFMNFFGAVAHDVAGVDAKDAIASAVLCRLSAVQAKGKKSGLFEGSRIDKPELHVDCRVGDNFTSLGVHRPLP